MARWFAYGRVYSSDPEIPNNETYQTAVLSWWQHLQPEWRQSTGELPLARYSPPEDGDWTCLDVSGRNGLLVVMMAFAWWGKAVGLSPSWVAASTDLKHTLQAVLDQRGYAARKRPSASAATKENLGPSCKRTRLPVDPQPRAVRSSSRKTRFGPKCS